MISDKVSGCTQLQPLRRHKPDAAD